MRCLTFFKRNFLEIARDPLSIIFTLILPLFLLFIFQQFDIPNSAYLLENFTPGIIVFSFSFISMFTATLLAKDRNTSFLTRLSTSPMRPVEYIVGYALALLPLVFTQVVLFFSLALILGLEFSVGVIFVLLCSFPISILFIALGLIIGTFTSEKSSAGVSSVIVQVVAFTSGMWFSGDMVGSGFNAFCEALPFSASVNILRGLLIGGEILPRSILIFIGYTIVAAMIAIVLFRKQVTNRK